MLIKCKDVMALPSLHKLKIVSGEAGLERVLRWVHFLDMPDVSNWVTGGELLFMTGMSLKSPMDLLPIVQEISDKNLAGLVITPGQYIPAIPLEVLNLANDLNFPIFELPWEVKLIEVFKEVTSFLHHRQEKEKSNQDIFLNLLLGDMEKLELLTTRAAYNGLDLYKPGQILLAKIKNLEEFTILKENTIDKTKERFQQILLEQVTNYFPKYLYLHWLDSLIFFLPSNKNVKNSDVNMKIAIKIMESLQPLMPELVVQMGLGNVCSDPREIRESFHQAEQAIKFGMMANKSCVFSYEQMGINKLLFAISEEVLHSFCNDYIAIIKNYDEKHSSNLMGDLEIFLLSNGNFGEAAKTLYIHRNTLIYRIRKIEEITGKSLDDFQTRIGFYFGIMAEKYIRKIVQKI